MTTATLTIGGSLGPYTDRGVSEDAGFIRNCLEALRNERYENMTFGRERSQTLHALQDVYDECSSENWDGYGATAIKADSYGLALKFLEALPQGLPAPELTVDPDGEICFEWDLGPRRVFSVSLGTRGELTFAGLFGRSKAYGTEYFNDDIPSPMVDHFNRLLAE